MHKSCYKEADYKTTLESTKAQNPVYYSFNLEIKNWQSFLLSVTLWFRTGLPTKTGKRSLYNSFFSFIHSRTRYSHDDQRL